MAQSSRKFHDVATTDAVTASANTAVVMTLAADANLRWVIESLDFGYSATPTGGKLTIATTGTVFEIAVPDASLHSKDFNPPIRAAKNQAVTITLAAGSGAVIGFLAVRKYKAG